MSGRRGIQTRGLLPKDLLNDLEREENVKERIKKFLDKPIDPPQMFQRGDGNPMFASGVMMSTAMSFSTFPIEVTALGDAERRFIPGLLRRR